MQPLLPHIYVCFLLTKENKCKTLRSEIFPHLGHFPAGFTRLFPFFAFGQQVLQGQSYGSPCGFVIYEILVLCPRDHE